MLPPQEGPEPGYIACVCSACAQSRANTIVALLHISSIVDGYVVDVTTTVTEHVNPIAPDDSADPSDDEVSVSVDEPAQHTRLQSHTPGDAPSTGDIVREDNMT